MNAAHPSSPSRIAAFINHEATAGLILVLAAALAMVFANTDLRSISEAVLGTKVTVAAGPLNISKPLLLWVNDGLMAIFFFLVGLEIKREFLEGNLSSREQIMLPALAAVGGMAAPALIYVLINWENPHLLRGWAIPAATDIAFALGALSIVGSRVPLTLKVFLLALATLDDLGAIIIIALFYTENLSVISLVGAAAGLVSLLLLNRLGVTRVAPYVFVGLVVWVFVLKSGIHATLAGVAVAFTIPLNRPNGTSLIHDLEEGLHPYVKFLILPLFAFANAGISFEGMTASKLLEPLALGIAAGLVVGKPVGIMLAVILAVRLRMAQLPANSTWADILGVSFLAGIGFTMSLFIGMLAFESPVEIAEVRIGVMVGSLISTALGLAVLFSAAGRRPVISGGG
jgi:NhaA family Na+:H+ antiporter